MTDTRTFEVVTRDLRKQEANAKRVIAQAQDFRVSKMSVETASAILQAVDKSIRETATLQDELRTNAWAVEARYVSRSLQSADAVITSVVEAGSRVMERAKPIAPLGECYTIAEAIGGALDSAPYHWDTTIQVFAVNAVRSMMLVVFTPDRAYLNDAESANVPEHRLTLMLGVDYPDTNMLPASARYSISVLYSADVPYPWEANTIFASFRSDLGAFTKQTCNQAIGLIAAKLSRFSDISVAFQRKRVIKPMPNELLPDDVCGLGMLPIKVIATNKHDNSIDVTTTAHGDLRPTTLLKLGAEIKRRLTAVVPVFSVSVIDSGLRIRVKPEMDATAAIPRIEQLAGTYDTVAA